MGSRLRVLVQPPTGSGLLKAHLRQVGGEGEKGIPGSLPLGASASRPLVVNRSTVVTLAGQGLGHHSQNNGDKATPRAV